MSFKDRVRLGLGIARLLVRGLEEVYPVAERVYETWRAEHPDVHNTLLAAVDQGIRAAMEYGPEFGPMLEKAWTFINDLVSEPMSVQAASPVGQAAPAPAPEPVPAPAPAVPAVVGAPGDEVEVKV